MALVTGAGLRREFHRRLQTTTSCIQGGRTVAIAVVVNEHFSQSKSLLAIATLVALSIVTTFLPAVALAEREHTVQGGQTLARIARRYHVEVADLAAANDLTRASMLREGQVLRIPDPGVTYVRPGQTLSRIAQDAGCSVQELMRINRLRDAGAIQAGQRLVLPGHEASAQREAAERRWGRPTNPGVVTFYRTSTREQLRIRLLDSRGRVRRAAVDQVSRLMRPRNAARRSRYPQPARRLLATLAHISDHFGGRRISVISGFRSVGGYTRETSQHVAGRALDIRIQGVPNEVLRDYLRSLGNFGVGYYPRSTFVHFDVRDERTYWVDWSRPGQAPQYQRRGDAPPGDATARELASVGQGGDDVGDEGGEGAIANDEHAHETEAPTPPGGAPLVADEDDEET